MKTKIISWIAQIAIVAIIGQTLFFKFTDHPDTIALFAELGMGPFGYKLIGTLELVACVLLLVPGGIACGAVLGWGLMSGALIAHLTEIGFSGPSGQLGFFALVAWLLCGLIIFLRRDQVPLLRRVFAK